MLSKNSSLTLRLGFEVAKNCPLVTSATACMVHLQGSAPQQNLSVVPDSEPDSGQ